MHTHLIHVGSFSGPKKSEVIVASGHIIELIAPDDTGGTTITSVDCFSMVRSLACFRLPGDQLILILLYV
jgi:hypothetical protein